MRFRQFVLPLAVLLCAVSCSSSADGKTSHGATSSPTPSTASELATQVIHLQGSDSLRFTPATLLVKPGRVKVVFTVTGHQPQNFTAPRLNASSGVVPAGRTVTINILIPQTGKYAFFSAYHKEQGMTGKIIATK